MYLGTKKPETVTTQITIPSDGLHGIKLGATVPAALQGRKGLWHDGADWWIGNWMDSDSGKLGVNVSVINSYAAESVGDYYMSTTGALTEGATIYYITDTETVTDIPSDTLSTLRSLTTLDGTNNIMVDGSTVQPWLSVKYRQDLQKYVKDKLAALQAAIISLGGNI